VTAWGESAGTYANFAGRVQWAAAALGPQANCRPAFVLLGDLFGLLTGGTAPARTAVHAALSAEVPAFATIDWDALPASTGQDMAGANASAAAPPPTGAAQKLTALGVPPAGR
jgi:predicted molibdopterin-dependent oxidoreductase YjgC